MVESKASQKKMKEGVLTHLVEKSTIDGANSKSLPKMEKHLD